MGLVQPLSLEKIVFFEGNSVFLYFKKCPFLLFSFLASKQSKYCLFATVMPGKLYFYFFSTGEESENNSVSACAFC